MKNVKWEEGLHGASGNYPPKNGKMLRPYDKVEPGMAVTAKCNEELINLQIIEETEPETYKASVKGYYFLNTPDELNDGDEVSIDREHILWLHGD